MEMEVDSGNDSAGRMEEKRSRSREYGQVWSKLSRVEQSSLRSPLPKGSTHVMPPVLTLFWSRGRTLFRLVRFCFYSICGGRRRHAPFLQFATFATNWISTATAAAAPHSPPPLTLVEANCVQANGKLRPQAGTPHAIASFHHAIPFLLPATRQIL